ACWRSPSLSLRSGSFVRMKAMEAPGRGLVRQGRVLSACRAAGCNRAGAMTNRGAGATLAIFGHQTRGPPRESGSGAVQLLAIHSRLSREYRIESQAVVVRNPPAS